MNDYMITTDNNADLPENFYKNHEVGCTYLSYTLEGKEYTEGNFLPVEEFYSKMRTGSMPTTSQVNPQSARALFEPYLKDGKDILPVISRGDFPVRSTAAGSQRRSLKKNIPSGGFW